MKKAKEKKRKKNESISYHQQITLKIKWLCLQQVSFYRPTLPSRITIKAQDNPDFWGPVKAILVAEI